MTQRVFCIALLACSLYATAGSVSATERVQAQSLVNPGAPTGSFASKRLTVGTTEVSLGQRERWIARAMERLQRAGPSGTLPGPNMRYTFSGRPRYGIEDEALLRFEDGGWLHVITHSNHLHDGVGNVILAVDDQGTFYRNDAHVCRRIEVRAPGPQYFGSVADFLAVPVDDYSWQAVPERPEVEAKH